MGAVQVSPVATDLQAVVDEILGADRLLLSTHEGPDGDALGSLLGLHHALESLGKDSVMFLAAKEFPLPVEYRFLSLEEVFHEPPADLASRLVVLLDCGNRERTSLDFDIPEGVRLLNIDHHHDNTRFGDVDLVDVAASSTAEIVFDIAEELGVALTPVMAEALYVGLVTDTGRFMYENTTPRTHTIASELIRAGVEPKTVYRRLYERVPPEKLRLLTRALGNVELFDGNIGITYVSSEDYRVAGATGELTEGIIDHIRAIEGLQVAAVVRDRIAGDGSERKVSLRSTDGGVDVSAVARSHGGGGHRQAAGFSTDLPYPEIVTSIRRHVADQLAS